MPVYAEPVAPLGPVYSTPAPRSGATIAADLAFGQWLAGLVPVDQVLAAGKQNLAIGDANLVSLSNGVTDAMQAWASSGARAALEKSADGLSKPNPVGGPTIPLSLTVPNVAGTVSPVQGLSTWLRNQVRGYLQQLSYYLQDLGAPPVYIPPVG